MSEVAGWAVAFACEEGEERRAGAATAVLSGLLGRPRVGAQALRGGHICALALAVRAQAASIEAALVEVRGEDPVAAVALLVVLEAAAAEAVAASPVLQHAVAAAAGRQVSKGAGAKDEGGDAAGKSSSQPTASSSSGSFDPAQAACALVADLVQGAEAQVGVHAQGAPWSSGAGGALASDAGVGPLYRRGRESSGASLRASLSRFSLACRHLFALRSLLVLALGQGVQPLLAACRGSAPVPELVSDDLACGAFVLDTGLRLIAPPVDSIRPGNVFTLSTFSFFTAAHFPVAAAVASAPVARGLPGGGRDPLAPLTAAQSQQRRIAVVLGQSYMVLAVILAGRGGASSRVGAPGSPGGTPAKVRGRALLVAPLHAVFVTPLPDAPTIVDVRILTRESFGAGLVQDLGPWKAEGGSRLGEGGLHLRVASFCLALDQLDAPGRVVAHVETARGRVLMTKVEDVAKLGTLRV